MSLRATEAIFLAEPLAGDPLGVAAIRHKKAIPYKKAIRDKKL
jgi:hypothetical protein